MGSGRRSEDSFTTINSHIHNDHDTYDEAQNISTRIQCDSVLAPFTFPAVIRSSNNSINSSPSMRPSDQHSAIGRTPSRRSSFRLDMSEVEQDSPIIRKRLDSLSRSRSFYSQNSNSNPLISPTTEESLFRQPTDPSSIVSLINITEKKSTLKKKLVMLKSWWSRCDEISTLPLVPSDLSSPKNFHKRRCELKRSLSSQDLFSISKTIGLQDEIEEQERLMRVNRPTAFNDQSSAFLIHEENKNESCNKHNQYAIYSSDIDNIENKNTKGPPEVSRKSSNTSLSMKTLTISSVNSNYPGPHPTSSPTKTRDSNFINTNTYLGQYRTLKTLGNGSFSEVKLAMDTCTDKLVAIKLIPKQLLEDNEQMSNSVENEISIMKRLSNPHVVKLLDSFETREDICIVLEYIDGGELFSTIAYRFETMNELRARCIFKQLAAVVKYLHDNHICHRDLKLENVLLGRNDLIKLTDFGFAKEFIEGIPLTARCGSEEYTAPEIILGTPYDGRKVDVWAMGVILFAILTGELPFNIEPGERPKAMYHRIARGEFKFPEDRKDKTPCTRILSPEAKDLIRCMIKQNASKRYFVEDILKHPWLHLPS